MTEHDAIREVCRDWRELAHAIRNEDAYASHVTEAEKDNQRDKMLQQADDIENGKSYGLTIAQRVYYKMTGHCPALLP